MPAPDCFMISWGYFFALSSNGVWFCPYLFPWFYFYWSGRVQEDMVLLGFRLMDLMLFSVYLYLGTLVGRVVGWWVGWHLFLLF